MWVPQKTAFAVFLTVATAPAYAGNAWNRVISECAHLLEAPYLELLEANSHETLLLTAQDPRGGGPSTLIGLSLTKRLGAGFFGQVVILDQITDPTLDLFVRQVRGNPYAGPVVVKIPHALRRINLGFSLPYTNAENLGEWGHYQLLQRKIPQIAAHPKFPKTSAWNKTVLPLAPISGVLRTSRGLLIFKPLLKGLDLKAIAKRTGAIGGKLPPEMLEGLKNHYNFTQAVYGSVSRFSTDIRPPNLLWLPGDTAEQRAQLAMLGYSRPGFIAFEMSQVPFNKPQYIDGPGLSFEDYLEEFESYLRKAQ